MGSFNYRLPILKPAATTPPNVSQQYTPPNWKGGSSALYAITFKAQGTVQQGAYDPHVLGGELETPVSDIIATTTSSRAGYNAATQMNMFVFDAIRRASHHRFATLTQHPLQTGFNISDHVVMQASQIVLEIGMSDAIDSYTVAGFTPMWKGNPSKSVSAYQQMEALMINRQIVTINTRLETYDNMVLIDITTEDTHKTYFGGLSMVLTFQEVFIADVSISYPGARIQSTGETTQGTVQPQPPSQTAVQQHKLLGTPDAPLINVPDIFPGVSGTTLSNIANWVAQGAQVPGAGLWSSSILPTLGGVTGFPF